MTNRDVILWYQALGLGPGQHEWRAVQKRYRRLVRQFHPDRLPSDSPQRAHAEERVKQINIAYRALAAQHKIHGQLPPCPPSPRHNTRAPVTPPRRPSHAPAAKARRDDAPAAQEKPARTPLATTARRQRTWVVPIAILAVLGYLAVTQLIEIAQRRPGDAPPGAGVPAVAGAKEPVRAAAPFTVGATLGEVYAAQGVPTSVEGDVWHYGLSTVQFMNGRVESWKEHSDYPLNARLFRPDEYSIESSRPRAP